MHTWNTYYTGNVEQYRALAKTLVKSDQDVLEVGCSFGETTKILAKKARRVVAVDHSKTVLSDTADISNLHTHVSFHQVDTRDTARIQSLMAKPHWIFIDIGGDAPAGRVADTAFRLLQIYATQINETTGVSQIRPSFRGIVIRCFELSLLNLNPAGVTQISEKKSTHYLRAPSSLASFYHYAGSPDKYDRIFAARLLPDLKIPPLGQSRQEFFKIIDRLSEDASFKVRFLTRQWRAADEGLSAESSHSAEITQGKH